VFDTDRRYVVQTLATVLTMHIQRPSLADCEVVTRILVEKFDVLSDDEGDGVVSTWVVCVCVLHGYYYLRELAVSHKPAPEM